MNEGKDYRAQFLWLHGVDYDQQRYWEQFSYGRPTEPTDEILVVVGPNGRAKWEPWGGPGVTRSGYIATTGFRRPIPRPTDRLLDAMACGWDRSGQAVVWKHPFRDEQTFDRKEATNYLERCEKDCEEARYFPMEFARQVSEIYADKVSHDTAPQQLDSWAFERGELRHLLLLASTGFDDHWAATPEGASVVERIKVILAEKPAERYDVNGAGLVQYARAALRVEINAAKPGDIG